MRTRRRPGKLGDFFVASVIKSQPTCSMKKGDVVRAYFVTSVYGGIRPTGRRIRYPLNGAVMVNKKQEPLASRVMVPLPSDLRRHGRAKRLTLAPQVI
jgi:large subunit ribosomal protein L14